MPYQLRNKVRLFRHQVQVYEVKIIWTMLYSGMWLSNDTVTSNLNLLAKITMIKGKGAILPLNKRRLKKNTCSTVEDFAIFHFITLKKDLLMIMTSCTNLISKCFNIQFSVRWLFIYILIWSEKVVKSIKTN